MTTIRISEFDNEGNKVRKDVKYTKDSTILIKWQGRKATIKGEFKDNKFYPTVIQNGQPDELISNGTFFLKPKIEEGVICSMCVCYCRQNVNVSKYFVLTGLSVHKEQHKLAS